MAIIKHIPVKNRYYSAAVEYLTCKFDEHTMKPLVDAKGRMIMRDNFLIEGINCEVDTFGAECIEVNRYYGKNNAIKDVKAHHYIISFAPEDNITMQEAMDFGKQYVEKFLPGHQAILAVHPDGHNGTGNVHVHIVINSVRKYEGKKERWQDKPCEYRQGCKHKSTGKFMRAAKCWVMRECMLKGYNQVNLLACSDGNDYWVEKRGKEAEPDFKTDKDMIRERLDALIQHAESLKHMIYYLEHVEDWQIRETNKTISFRMPHMKKSIRGKSLGERYDKDALENRIAEIIALKEEKLRAEQETMREETLEITKEQAFVAIPVEATAAEELEKIVEVEEPAAEMFEAILEDEYLVAGESKLVYETSTSSEPDYTEELAELQSRFICLQYEFQYNLDKISDLDYEHRYRDPEYITYQSNLLRIVDKSLYINQWTEELAKCGLFQKDLKMMYKEQIEAATIEVKRIEEENERILDKAGCRSESELYAKQQAYDKNWSLCNTLAERNRSIKEECEGITLEYAQLFRGAEGVLNSEGFGNNKQVDDIAEKKAKAILKDMHGKDFSEYGFRDACIKAEMKLQNVDKDRSYERGVRIR
ncbi:hypothetical protein DXB01_00460 [Clostridium sp. OF10-22XD]|nr:hypothetical protein DXB01_00460 [Clostridium sp. OF10-22XD]